MNENSDTMRPETNHPGLLRYDITDVICTDASPARFVFGRHVSQFRDGKNRQPEPRVFSLTTGARIL
jgi:hypothetical protein